MIMINLRITSPLILLIHILILLHVYYFGSRNYWKYRFSRVFSFILKLGVINAGVLLSYYCFYYLHLLFGRFFCGWACHFGAIQELSWYILKKT